jgi:DNA-binding NtrC family response regulator
MRQRGSVGAILLVEDDPLEAHLIMSLLRRQGAEVCRATDAAEALCAVEQPEFAGKLSLVISGPQSKGIGGPSFVAELRERMPDVLILVTGMVGESTNDYAGNLVTFLPFPALPQQVVSVVGKLLARREDQVPKDHVA